MNRRELFPILGAAVSALEAAEYKPRLLSEREYAMVTSLANIILPADDISKGAGDAGAAFFIDTLLFHASQPSQEQFRNGLKPFLGLDVKAQDHMLAELESAKSPFFDRLRNLVIDAYTLTPEVRAFLRYNGDRAIQEFTGCDHPEHKTV